MISEKATVSKDAVLERGVRVKEGAIIEAGAIIRKNVFISAYAYIRGNVEIDEGTFIGKGAIIGEVPQILGVKHLKGRVYIGKNNVLREYVTVHSPSSDEGVTYIGDNNYLMAFSHIAHDCCLGNNIVICNGSLVAGHIKIEDKAFVSGNSVLHQFIRVGYLSIIGGLSRVNRDVPPFMMVVGNSRVWGINRVGLTRAGFSLQDISEVKKIYKIIYREGLSFNNAVREIEKLNTPLSRKMLTFLKSSRRGICSPKRNSLWERIFLNYPYFIYQSIPTYFLFLKINQRQNLKT